MTVLAIGTLPGCEDEQVHSYQAPKAAPYSPPEPISPAGGHDHATPGITWDLPDSWQPTTGASSMAMAAFEAPGEPEGLQPANITVTVLAGEAGGLMGNINRWRGQVGLAPINTADDQPMTVVHIDQSSAALIDLVSPQGVEAGIERMLVVLVPRQQENQTWFIKMTGPNDTVTLQKQNFIGFVESIRFGGAGGTEDMQEVGETAGTVGTGEPGESVGPGEPGEPGNPGGVSNE